MGHPFGDAHRNVAGSDVLAHADVFEPFLLPVCFGGVSLKKGRVETGRNVIFGQQVTGEGPELQPGFVVFRPPIFDWANPILVVAGDLFEPGEVRVGHVVPETS